MVEAVELFHHRLHQTQRVVQEVVVEVEVVVPVKVVEVELEVG